MNDFVAAAPARVDGYAQLRDYAVTGDGGCVALIARDGAVDWLSQPDLDSPTLFAAVLGQVRGGRFLLRPVDVPYPAAAAVYPVPTCWRRRSSPQAARCG